MFKYLNCGIVIMKSWKQSQRWLTVMGKCIKLPVFPIHQAGSTDILMEELLEFQLESAAEWLWLWATLMTSSFKGYLAMVGTFRLFLNGRGYKVIQLSLTLEGIS